MKALQSEHIKELTWLHRQSTGAPLTVAKRSHPKTKEQHIDVLVYVGHGQDTEGVRGTQAPRKQLGLRTITMPHDSAVKPLQRHNEAWKCVGEAYPGQKNWRPSGKACARDDASRSRLEV